MIRQCLLWGGHGYFLEHKEILICLYAVSPEWSQNKTRDSCDCSCIIIRACEKRGHIVHDSHYPTTNRLFFVHF